MSNHPFNHWNPPLGWLYVGTGVFESCTCTLRQRPESRDAVPPDWCLPGVIPGFVSRVTLPEEISAVPRRK
jgi:hypothetical protein